MNDPNESRSYNQATHAYIMEQLDSLIGRVHLLESKAAERDNSVDGIPEKLSGDIPEAMRFYDLLDIEKAARNFLQCLEIDPHMCQIKTYRAIDALKNSIRNADRTP